MQMSQLEGSGRKTELGTGCDYVNCACCLLDMFLTAHAHYTCYLLCIPTAHVAYCAYSLHMLPSAHTYCQCCLLRLLTTQYTCYLLRMPVVDADQAVGGVRQVDGAGNRLCCVPARHDLSLLKEVSPRVQL